MRINRLLLALFLLLALLSGCRRAEEGTLLFRDRFGNENGGWGSESQSTFDRGYQRGEYFIEVYEPDWLAWARPHERFTDVDIEVEAHQVAGSPDGHFGALCRFRAPDDFYYFAVSDDGYYAIMRVENGEAEVLTGDGMLPSAAIQTGGAVNVIRAVCMREQLTLYVNDEQVASVTDDAFQRGDVGLGVGAGPAGAIRVHFDNFTVAAP